jgi:P-type Cu2+ transporter
MSAQQQTVVLEVAGVHWASEKAVAEAVLGRRPGVRQVEANPVGQTATVTYDPAQTSVAELSGWVRDCGYHCAGQSVPWHVCDPAAEPHDHSASAAREDHRPSVAPEAPHEHAAPRRAEAG